MRCMNALLLLRPLLPSRACWLPLSLDTQWKSALPQAFPPLQPLTGLPLASHFPSTLALNSHSGLQYTDKLFPPKRTHYLQGRKQGMMSLWRKCLPRTEDPRWKEWEHTLPPPPPPPPFVPVDLTWPKRSQEIKYLCPGPYPGQLSFSHITLLLSYPILLSPENCIWGKSYIWFQDIQQNIQQCLQRLCIPISL